jgi:hypothetical protein
VYWHPPPPRSSNHTSMLWVISSCAPVPWTCYFMMSTIPAICLRCLLTLAGCWVSFLLGTWYKACLNIMVNGDIFLRGLWIRPPALGKCVNKQTRHVPA